MYFMVDQSTPFFHYLVEECLWFNNPFLDCDIFVCSGAVYWQSGKLTEN